MAATAAKSKYQRLQSAKKSLCSGRIDKKRYNKVEKIYINDATAKGKTATEAQKIADAVLNAACPVAAVGATKKRKTAAKKTTTKRKTAKKR